jgi:hypothetical protein
MLREECIQLQVCKYPDDKCAVVERGHRTFLDRLYKHITYNNTYRYTHIFPKFVKAYNGTVYLNIGMVLS